MTARANGSAGVTVRERRGTGEEAARAANVRRGAWLLGLLAFGFYVGFIVWNLFLRPQLGG